MSPDVDLAGFVPLATPWAIAMVMAMARAAGLVLGLPFGGPGVPRTIKAIVVLALALAAVTGRPLPGFDTGSYGLLSIALVGEFLLGFGMGFIVQLALATTRVAGELIGIEMGLSFAAVADPLSRGQSTAASALTAQVGVQLALALRFDHVVVRALFVSMDHQALGSGQLSTAAMAQLVELGNVLTRTAFRLALPLMAALFALKLSMALLARVAPKLQIFTLAFALSITVGLNILHIALPAMFGAMTVHFREFVEVLDAFARS